MMATVKVYPGKSLGEALGRVLGSRWAWTPGMGGWRDQGGREALRIVAPGGPSRLVVRVRGEIVGEVVTVPLDQEGIDCPPGHVLDPIDDYALDSMADPWACLGMTC